MAAEKFEETFEAAIKACSNNTKIRDELYILLRVVKANYISKKTNYDLNSCNDLATQLHDLVSNLDIATEKELNEFFDNTRKYKTCNTTARILASIIGAVIGMISGAAIGFLLGSIPGAIIGGVTGAVAVSGASTSSHTMWSLKNHPLSKIIAEAHTQLDLNPII